MNSLVKVSTGLKGLDEVIDSLRIGDNVVWQVETIEDYKDFVQPFVRKALEEKRKVIYMRFAQHAPILDNENITIYELDAYSGFESFSTKVHEIITQEKERVFYVFDCLSDLLPAWATDLMIGNFFMITCPYLFELNTIAYFALLRDRHMFQTIARIRETTQLLLDVYNFESNIYVHPLKVWDRYSPTMFLPHVKKEERFAPLTSSIDAMNLFAHMPKRKVGNEKRNLDYWDRLFLDGEILLQKKKSAKALEEQKEMAHKLNQVIVGKDDKILTLAKDNFSLEDLLQIKSRLIGSGCIGGKAVGMLLARKILLKDSQMDWKEYLEAHDSYYIGADVFYTYLVQNGWWKLRMKQRTKEGYFEAAGKLREKMLKGKFPEAIREQFRQMLEYFGQAPIIVRSSSLLEDGFGNAFSGKYESVFCVNQGTPGERYEQFECAVRTVFASTMSEDALTYRKQRGLDGKDEQMALLVQRVSGGYHKKYFFPFIAGVGNSYNSYVWKKEMNPKAGMLRLVFGLGTHAVNRADSDYPRVVALDMPLLKPLSGMEDARKFSQHEVDVLDLEKKCWRSILLSKLKGEDPSIQLNLIGVRDHETNRRMRELGIQNEEAWILSFDKLLSDTSFSHIMQQLLKLLEKIYRYPVDIEFTVNFSEDGKMHINLLQCRPLQTKGKEKVIKIPKNIEKEKIFVSLNENFMGGNIAKKINRIIYIDPKKYSELEVKTRYEIARTIGKLNKQVENQQKMPTMLLGPGRWGTSTPYLGIPVTFSEISNMAVLGEIEFRNGGLVPELSFGTHFFQDLVETDIFYIAIFSDEEKTIFNQQLMEQLPNLLGSILPEEQHFENIVKVCDVTAVDMHIYSDMISQQVICYTEKATT